CLVIFVVVDRIPECEIHTLGVLAAHLDDELVHLGGILRQERGSVGKSHRQHERKHQGNELPSFEHGDLRVGRYGMNQVIERRATTHVAYWYPASSQGPPRPCLSHICFGPAPYAM